MTRATLDPYHARVPVPSLPSAAAPERVRGYQPEAIWSARRSFFDEGHTPAGIVHEAVLRSWARCCGNGRDVHEPVEFQPLDRACVSSLLASHSELLQAAEPELADLAASVAPAGYAVLLTDCSGSALAVDGAIAQCSVPLRQAFRAGVDLSEAAIGTSAMAVALREAQPARVLGPEHFHTATQIFHCSAAPVFDPQGEIIGSVDVSRDMPGMRDAALWLAARCARRIERSLFQRLPALVHVEIDIGAATASHPDGSGAWLAFGPSGELVAANRAARTLLGLHCGVIGRDFEHLFEDRFGPWVSALRRSGRSAAMRLKDGLQLRALPLGHGTKACSARPMPSLQTPNRPVHPEFGDARMDAAFARTLKVACAGVPVLITGETGTGKEVAARALHAAGTRARAPFVALNCAAIPGDLLAGELFGHVEGAFTGARRGGSPGKIEAAHGGTLFLDEIGDMPMALQAALLRVLDSGEVMRLGCTQPRPVQFNIICATHRHLPALVRQGAFREDLMYRVAGHILALLPLRERENFDVVLDALIARFGGSAKRVPDDLRAHLQGCPWRGNVRELSHAVQRALALADADEDLHREHFDMAGTCPQASSQAGASLQALTQQAIDCAMADAQGRVTEAARQLGISRATLYRRLKRGRQPGY